MARLEPQELSFADTAPVIAETIGVIDGSAAEVWAVIVDHGSWPRWFTDVKACEATSDPPAGVGSTRRVTLARGAAVDELFIAWDEPELWAFTAVEAPPAFSALVERVTLRQLGPQLTEVTYRMAIRPSKGLGLLVKAAKGTIQKRLKVALRNLNAEVVRRRREAGDAPASAADE
ncbi:MAG: SRPBCC family protein [Acidimicrobiales bacterium]